MIEDRKRNFIPGMIPLYDPETQKKVNVMNYQDFNNH